MRVFATAALMLGLALPGAGLAQQNETLADIRQQLALVHVDVQRLKRELSTTGGQSGTDLGGTTIERLNTLEAELQRLTAKTEQLEYRIEQVVSDGSNKLGDLTFRLCELETDCDIAKEDFDVYLGGVKPAVTPTVPTTQPTEVSTGGELAVGETQDFKTGRDALSAGEYATAEAIFTTFIETYPGSPLEAEAHLRRGQALEEQQQLTDAARAYLESYSGTPQGPVADEALYRLGAALGSLGQINEACVTLNEVGVRHPNSPFAIEAQNEMSLLTCQ